MTVTVKKGLISNQLTAGHGPVRGAGFCRLLLLSVRGPYLRHAEGMRPGAAIGELTGYDRKTVWNTCERGSQAKGYGSIRLNLTVPRTVPGRILHWQTSGWKTLKKRDCLGAITHQRRSGPSRSVALHEHRSMTSM